MGTLPDTAGSGMSPNADRVLVKPPTVKTRFSGSGRTACRSAAYEGHDGPQRTIIIGSLVVYGLNVVLVP